MEGLSKKEKGLIDMDNNVVIAGDRGVLKNTIKIKLKKIKMKIKAVRCSGVVLRQSDTIAQSFIIFGKKIMVSFLVTGLIQ